MADLSYAVIALKNSEVDGVLAKLKDKQLYLIADWLTAKRGENFYGGRNEDWRPFDERTISQLINETKGYQTQTNLIDDLDDELSDISKVRTSVRIYFIDVFALFLDKYALLATRLDALVASNAECCLIVSHELSREIQEQLIGKYCGVLNEVCREYRAGHLHRIVMRIDDLRNFRNGLLRLYGSEDRPSTVANNELDSKFHYDTRQPPTL